MDQVPPFEGPYPDRPDYGQRATDPARFAVHASERPVTLTFESWRTEYVVPAGDRVEVEIDLWTRSSYLPSIIHHEDGITIVSAGIHPTVWRDGRLLPITAAQRPPLHEPPEGI